MKNSLNKQRLQIVLIVVVAVLALGIGYATISSINLIINGNATASVETSNFKVKFLSEQGVTPTIDGSPTNSVSVVSDTVATFDISTLNGKGQTVTATYKIKNVSNGIGASIGLNVTSTNTEYFKVTETITDNKLQAGEETTATVTVEMLKTPINNSVSTSVTATLIATPLDNESATGGSSASKASDDPVSFSIDSWATIQKAVQNNNTSAYSVGDTTTVTIGANNYTVRLVNKTTGEHCGDNDTAYSQTACGFVVEFVDIVEQRAMNSTNTNVGGWPGSELYTYLQGTFYNSLPSDLKSAIKPTRVISGYGNNGTDSANFTSTDNLYLLSGVEIYGADDYDTAASTTHQLEYYVNMPSETYDPCGGCGATAYRYPRAIKQYNGSDWYYWLRPAYSAYSIHFRFVYASGILDSDYAYASTDGVAPAFRIG